MKNSTDIKKSQVTGTAGHFSADASDLGWEPGFWPDKITFDGQPWTQTSMRKDPDQDVVFVNYMGTGRETFTVFND